MALFVLGAGATRGGSFVNLKNNPCLPPLDGDFYAQLQRIQNAKHKKTVTQVIEDTVQLFGVNFDLTLETVFTTLEHTIRMVGTTGDNRDFKTSELTQKRNRLVQAIAAVIEESIAGQKCEFHQSLVEDLKNNDEIISFNYDCMIDSTLKEFGSQKWNPHYGYGFSLGSHGANLHGDKYWSPKEPAGRDDTIKLYKLHGSLHFFIKDKRITLKQRPYTKQAGNLKFTIIPPELQKEYDTGVFSRLWKQAGSAIHRAAIMVIIGYSFPANDLHSTALFRICVKNEALKSLVIVNPDGAARRRTRDVLQRGIGPKTKVLVFKTFEEFVSTKRSLWDK